MIEQRNSNQSISPSPKSTQSTMTFESPPFSSRAHFNITITLFNYGYEKLFLSTIEMASKKKKINPSLLRKILLIIFTYFSKIFHENSELTIKSTSQFFLIWKLCQYKPETFLILRFARLYPLKKYLKCTKNMPCKVNKLKQRRVFAHFSPHMKQNCILQPQYSTGFR